MPEPDTLTADDLRQLNALMLSFSITGIQAISLYRLAGGTGPRLKPRSSGLK